MIGRSREEIERAAFAYLQHAFSIASSEIDRHTELVRTGLLDSVSLVQLATWAERAFGIQIPDEDINAEHLESIARITEYVQRRLSVS
jgi:acyl carrier protein